MQNRGRGSVEDASQLSYSTVMTAFESTEIYKETVQKSSDQKKEIEQLT